MAKEKVDKSNYDPAKCWAKSKRTGQQCGGQPINGTRVCRMHGGNLPAAKAKYAREQEEARIRRVAKRLGTPAEEGQDPAQVLLDQVASKAAEVEWLRRQIELINSDEDLFWSTQKEITKDMPTGTYTEEVKEAGQHVIYQIYQKAQDQLVKYAGETLRAGVEERQVQAAERTGEQFEKVLMAVLSAINATPDQLQTASTEIPRILRDMSA